jgi:hypothetical protein
VKCPSLRLVQLLILVGFLGVIGGSIAWIVGFSVTNRTDLVINLAPPIGYGLVGVAWWQWLPATQAVGTAVKSIRRSSRILALASVITGLGYLAIFYQDLRLTYSLPGADHFPNFRLQLAVSAASAVGFFLAASGLWVASNITESSIAVLEEADSTAICP